MLKLAVAGLGKMGLSHHAIINTHPDVSLEAVCDSSAYVLDVLRKYTGIRTYTDFDSMLRNEELDAVIIATPTRLHEEMVLAALRRGLHVFCEKPFCLNTIEGEQASQLAQAKGLVTQVGYHNRFIGAFQEVKRVLDCGAIGKVTHVIAEAYGPVVLRPKGSTWRTRRSEGGGCLYDYAAHAINLLNWYFGAPYGASGSLLKRIFSDETDDEVVSTLRFADDISAQISVNWSDESYRKMGTSIRIVGAAGRIFADRQECHVYVRDTVTPPTGYQTGWNARYITDLTAPVWFYMRGEEYSAQLEYFIHCIEGRIIGGNTNSFDEALETDRAIDLIVRDAQAGHVTNAGQEVAAPAKRKRRWFFWWR